MNTRWLVESRMNELNDYSLAKTSWTVGKASLVTTKMLKKAAPTPQILKVLFSGPSKLRWELAKS